MKPMFQRRHYEFLVHWASIHIQPVEVASLADVLVVDNPRFDRKRFLKTYVELRRFAKAHDEARRVAWIMPVPASPEAIEAAEDLLGPTHGETPSTPVAPLVRDRECLSCHHVWVSPVVMSPLTRNLSGEARAFCPACQSGNVMSLPWRAATINMDAHIRAHADANRGRGMWEYTRCWKCDSGRRPDHCPVACKGACAYPSAIND